MSNLIDLHEHEMENLLHIRTTGRDETLFDGDHHPYEPTDYRVLERLANTGYIRKNNTLLDYGCGKGRVSLFMAYQTRCHAIGIEFDERLYEKALENKNNAVAGERVSFVHKDAAQYFVTKEVDRAFFFNPFSLATLEQVVEQIITSVEKSPRKFLMFFYYPEPEAEKYLMHHPQLTLQENIDCKDLFVKANEQEKILVFAIVGREE